MNPRLAACADLFDHTAHTWAMDNSNASYLCPGVGPKTATAGPVPTADEVARFLDNAVSDDEFINGKTVPIVTEVTPIAVFDKDVWACPAECGITHADVADLVDHLRGFHEWPQSDIDEFKELAGVNDAPEPSDLVHEATKLTQADKVAELSRWWIAQAQGDVDMVASKAVAYGSNSLTQLGNKLAQLQGRDVSVEEAQELGCWINLVQKIERLTDAVLRGERGSDDSITDAIAYLVMMRRIRVKGSWPGV